LRHQDPPGLELAAAAMFSPHGAEADHGGQAGISWWVLF